MILEVPDPIRLAMLGLIDAGLPTEDDALIELHIDVLGIIDFGAKTLSIDGSLYDSRVLIYSLAGDLALRLNWGDNPELRFLAGRIQSELQYRRPGCSEASAAFGEPGQREQSADQRRQLLRDDVEYGAVRRQCPSLRGGRRLHHPGLPRASTFSLLCRRSLSSSISRLRSTSRLTATRFWA